MLHLQTPTVVSQSTVAQIIMEKKYTVDMSQHSSSMPQCPYTPQQNTVQTSPALCYQMEANCVTKVTARCIALQQACVQHNLVHTRASSMRLCSETNPTHSSLPATTETCPYLHAAGTGESEEHFIATECHDIVH